MGGWWEGGWEGERITRTNAVFDAGNLIDHPNGCKHFVTELEQGERGVRAKKQDGNGTHWELDWKETQQFYLNSDLLFSFRFIWCVMVNKTRGCVSYRFVILSKFP